MSKRPTVEELRQVTGSIGSVDSGAWQSIASATEADLRRKGMTLDMDINPKINNLQAFGEVPDSMAPVPLNNEPQQYQSMPKDSSDNSIDFAIDVCIEALDAARNIIRARTGQRADLRMLVKEVVEESLQDFLRDI